MQMIQVLRVTTGRLAALSETPALDAQVLLAHLLGVPHSWILAHPDENLSAEHELALERALQRLEGGEALPYVIGHWEFYGLDFTLTPDVLIPRPETELLVERALAWLGANPGWRRAADIGTGSGCIAVTLAATVPDLQILASDISVAALGVARTNAQKHGVESRIQFVQADLLDISPSTFDLNPFNLIVANLPYIPSPRLQSLDVAQREPGLALDGGADGLEPIKRLLKDAPAVLTPGGLLLLEIDEMQGEAVRQLAVRSFPKAQIEVMRDLAGSERLVEIRLPD